MDETTPPVLILRAQCTIAHVESLYETLSQEKYAGGATLDASGVDLIDTAGLQLLLAWLRHQRSSGGTVVWGARSEALQDALRDAGCAEHCE